MHLRLLNRTPRLDRAPASALPAGRRVAPALGYEIRLDASLRALHAHAAELRALVDEHGVVFLRGVPLDERAFADVADALGDRTVHPLHRLLGRSDSITVIQDDEKRPPAGFGWHRDLSWLSTPPTHGLLQALEVPDRGGDTMWADLATLYDALPADIAERINGALLHHRIDDSFAATVERHHGPDIASRLRDLHPPVLRPMIQQLADGRRRLAVSPLYQATIAGFDESESEEILGLVDEILEDPSVAVRWHWQAGDIAIWDEAATVHRALTDHHPARRRMRRCTVMAPRR